MIRKSLLAAAIAAPLALTSHTAFAQAAGVEPQADKIFRAMTSYVSGLKQFSAQTENTIGMNTSRLRMKYEAMGDEQLFRIASAKIVN